MENIFLSESETKIRDLARAVTKSVPNTLIQNMESERSRFPREFITLMAERKLLGLRFSEQYGGASASWTAEMAAIEEIGVLGYTLACLYSLGSIVGEPIYRFGSKEMKEKYLSGITSGTRYGAEAITEPSGGSDLFGMMKTTATKNGNRYLLNGQKRFVVGGEGADFFVTYAITDKDAKPRHRGVSAFVVDRDTPGFTVQTLYGLMGNKGGGTARLVFKDAEVPEENLIGNLNGGYEIFNRMMIPERLTTAAGSIGIAMASLEIAAEYSQNRIAFNQKLSELEPINFKIAEMITSIDVSRGLVYRAAKAAEAFEKNQLSLGTVRRMISEAKFMSTEMSWKVVNDAMQILGGIGYTTVYPLERLLRDSRLGMIWTGTNEVMRLIIQHEVYKELNEEEYRKSRRKVENDALNFELVDEKVYR